MAAQRFSDDTIRRIAAGIRSIEQRPLKDQINRPQDLAGTFHNWQFIKITGAITGNVLTGCATGEGLAVAEYYPGVITNYNQDTEAWEDTTNTVWARPPVGVTLANNDLILARQTKASGCVNSDNRPVFAGLKSVSTDDVEPSWCLGPFISAYTCTDNGDSTFTPNIVWSYAHFNGIALTINTTPCP